MSTSGFLRHLGPRQEGKLEEKEKELKELAKMIVKSHPEDFTNPTLSDITKFATSFQSRSSKNIKPTRTTILFLP